MKVYIAAPYSKGDQFENLRKVLDVADKLAELGFTPFIPHLYCFWHFISPKSYEFWMNQDMEWLETCDILYRIKGVSDGADKEVKRAEELGIPVVYSVDGISKIL